MLLKAGKLEIRNSQKSSMLESWIAESNVYNCQTESPSTINYIFRQINILYIQANQYIILYVFNMIQANQYIIYLYFTK